MWQCLEINRPLLLPISSAMLTMVARLTAAEDFEEYARVALEGLMELIPSFDASYNEMDPEGQNVFIMVLPPPEPGLIEELTPVFERFMWEHPLFEHYMNTGDTQAVMWSDFVTLEEMRSREIHKRMFSKMGVDSQLTVTLPAPEGIVIGFALNRGPEGFSERDRLVLNTLRPHLVNTHRSVQAKLGAATWRSVLTADGWVSLLVDDDGRLVDSSIGAVEAAERYGIELGPGRTLPEALLVPFRERLKDYDGSQLATPSAPVQVTADESGVQAWIVPSPVPPHVVLLRASGGEDRTRLVDAGLTSRQVDVAVELLEGGTNRQIAQRMDMAEGTRKKHLEHIYFVLDADDRATAAARIRSLIV
jgi:DNA-binding CsgD family transcriptional regulator